jgi:hypothetical protein
MLFLYMAGKRKTSNYLPEISASGILADRQLHHLSGSAL